MSKTASTGGGAKVPTYDALLANIPLSDSAKTVSINALIKALYQAGVIYTEELSDEPNAIEKFTGARFGEVHGYDDS